jgi:hypothetical protein
MKVQRISYYHLLLNSSKIVSQFDVVYEYKETLLRWEEEIAVISWDL